MGRWGRVKVLLDTHVLLWAMVSPRLLSPKVAEMMDGEANAIYVSAASAWEIATKVRLGKLPGADFVERNFVENVRRAGYSLIAIDAEIALRAGRLAGAHRDPFDRMLAAHALAEDIPVLSADGKLDEFGVRRIW